MRDTPHIPTVSVPDDLKVLEADYQRILYVESRLSKISALKHDKLMLRERFLGSLHPPEVLDGFSKRINQLCQQIDLLNNEKLQFTSQVAELQRKQISVVIQDSLDLDDIAHREDEVLSYKPFVSEAPRRKYRVLKTIIILSIGAIIGFRCGCDFTRFRYFPGPVDSGPVGVEHSIKGGTTNGASHQPQQGPLPQSQGNSRVPKNLP